MLVLLLPSLGYRGCRLYTQYFIVQATDGFHFYTEEPKDEEELISWYDDPSFIEVHTTTLRPQIKTGPIAGIFDFYQTSSFLNSPDEYSWRISMELTQEELVNLHQGLVNFAKNDPWLSQYQPGAPARIEFLPAATLFSLTKVGTYLGFPALILWLTRYFKTHTRKAIANRRRDAGLCIHCAYDCKDLPSPTCPECGQPHTVQLKSDA